MGAPPYCLVCLLKQVLQALVFQLPPGMSFDRERVCCFPVLIVSSFLSLYQPRSPYPSPLRHHSSLISTPSNFEHVYHMTVNSAENFLSSEPAHPTSSSYSSPSLSTTPVNHRVRTGEPLRSTNLCGLPGFSSSLLHAIVPALSPSTLRHQLIHLEGISIMFFLRITSLGRAY